MKHLFTLLLTVLLAFASELHAVQPVFLAEIQGSLASQKVLGPADGRIETDKLDNNRVFQLFGVSKEDYALVFDSEVYKLILRQKNSGGALPDIVVLDITFPAAAVDTKKKFFRATAGMTSPATGNLFEDLEGFAASAISYKGSIEALRFDKFSFKFVGFCSTSDPASSSKSVLRFSLRTGKEF